MLTFPIASPHHIKLKSKSNTKKNKPNNMRIGGVVGIVTPASSPSSFSSLRRCFYTFPFSSSLPPYLLLSLRKSISILPSMLLTASASSTASSEANKPCPWLIVGLGNPGKKYLATRHNVGFEMVDAIAKAEQIPLSSVSFKALFGKGYIGSVPVMLAKPHTFMNVSGESVGPIVSYYKIPLKRVLVIYDDLDLPFAKLRLLPKGGHGGHNGMRSIIDHFKGSRDFPRLRIGIGRPPGKMDPTGFVLRPFIKQEREELDFTFQLGLEAVRILVLEGINKSATFVNSAKSVEQLS